MPSPIGHALAGLAVAWAGERPAQGTRFPRAVLIACVALAVLPDADLVYYPIHRTVTHSFTMTALVTIVAAAVTGWVTGRIDWRVAFTCGLAHLSHLVLDWLGQDFNVPRGLQALWPFSDRWFVSGWDVFRRTERQEPLSLPSIIHNLRTAAQEILIFAPIIIALWMARRARAGRLGEAVRARKADDASQANRAG